MEKNLFEMLYHIVLKHMLFSFNIMGVIRNAFLNSVIFQKVML